MNRSNGTPVDVSEIDRFWGLPQTVAVAIFFATYIRGGLWQESAFFCGSTHFVYFFASQWFSLLLPGHPAPEGEGRGKTRATPPFLPLYRQTGKGVCGRVCGIPCPPLFGGRSRLICPCGKAPNLNPKRALRRRRQAP